MKKLALLLWLAGLVTTHAHVENSLENPDFEKGTERWTLKAETGTTTICPEAKHRGV
jgi:hypothetical protein